MKVIKAGLSNKQSSTPLGVLCACLGIMPTSIAKGLSNIPTLDVAVYPVMHLKDLLKKAKNVGKVTVKNSGYEIAVIQLLNKQTVYIEYPVAEGSKEPTTTDVFYVILQ